MYSEDDFYILVLILSIIFFFFNKVYFTVGAINLRKERRLCFRLLHQKFCFGLCSLPLFYITQSSETFCLALQKLWIIFNLYSRQVYFTSKCKRRCFWYNKSNFLIPISFCNPMLWTLVCDNIKLVE